MSTPSLALWQPTERPTIWPFFSESDASAALEEDVIAGCFSRHTFSDGRAQRDYKLYVPASFKGTPLPLIMMLHGCGQDADDFACGTRMNEIAEEIGFLVVYPEQPKDHSRSAWNWFSASEQSRMSEEPSLLAGIVARIEATHCVDANKVFVAGLSAGGAMAVLLGETYPDVFRAVASHSGLPFGIAQDTMSAVAAMQGFVNPFAFLSGCSTSMMSSRHSPPRTVIVHGESDCVVSPTNSRKIELQAIKRHEEEQAGPMSASERRVRLGDRECQVVTHTGDNGTVLVERWSVSGGGHAWFGGCNLGSFADEKGPDISRETVRFFLE